MPLTETELARRAATDDPRRIDYERMNKVFPKQKAALTRAKNSGDPEKVLATCRKTVKEWNEIGAWPDDWALWQRTLDDSRDIYDSIELRDLD